MASKYESDPEFRRKWDENSGWLGHADKKEKALEAQRKGGRVSAERAKAQKKLKEVLSSPDGFRQEALEAILEVDPNAIDKFAKSIYKNALDGDKFSADLVSKMLGLDAPKKSEITVKEEMSPEEALQILNKAGAKMTIPGVNDKK